MGEVIMQSFYSKLMAREHCKKNTKLWKKMGEKEGMYIISTYCEKIEEQCPYFLRIV
jgi:RNA binding exosome subunit